MKHARVETQFAMAEQSDLAKKRILKLRWIGMEKEALQSEHDLRNHTQQETWWRLAR